MAGHPLRPATRRRLGRPSPHQQADRPRAHPTPQKLSPTRPCDQQGVFGIRPSFPGLSQSAGQITHVLLTRSPLEYPRKGLSVRLACVKHAASVRPEPESNSPNKNNPSKRQVNSNQNKPDLTKRHQKLASKTKTTQARQEDGESPHKDGNKKQQTKTTKHTIEFSNNTPGFQATLPLYSTWSGTSNLVLQSSWTGAVGFSLKPTPYPSQTQSGPADRDEGVIPATTTPSSRTGSATQQPRSEA